MGWAINNLKAREIFESITKHTSRHGGTSTAIFGPMGAGKTTLLWHFTQLIQAKDPVTNRWNPEIRIWRGRAPIDNWTFSSPEKTIVYIHEDDNVNFSLELTDRFIYPNLERYKEVPDLIKKILEDPYKLHVVYEPRKYKKSWLLDEVLDQIESTVNIPKRLKSSIFWFEMVYYLVKIFPKSGQRNFYCLYFDEADQVFPGRPAQKIQWHLQEWLRDNIVDTRKAYVSFFVATHNYEDLDWRVIKKFQYKIWGSGAIPPKRGSLVSSSKTLLMKTGTFVLEGKGFGSTKFPPLPELHRAMIDFL